MTSSDDSRHDLWGERALSEGEMLALWQVAWRMASRRCAATLARLRRGDGGFYGADDLYQDLFLEFWALANAWRRDEGLATLWSAWRRRLWGGGRRLLRRAPQRLWSYAERAIDPQALEGAADDEPLPATRQALILMADDAGAHDGLAKLQALERALWTLPPAQRQALYMAGLLEAPAAELARLLTLENTEAAYVFLHRARRALRRALAREEG